MKMKPLPQKNSPKINVEESPLDPKQTAFRIEEGPFQGILFVINHIKIDEDHPDGGGVLKFDFTVLEKDEYQDVENNSEFLDTVASIVYKIISEIADNADRNEDSQTSSK